MDIAKILTLGDTSKILEVIETQNTIDGLDSIALQEIYDGKHSILNRADKPKVDKDGNVIGTTSTAKIVLNYQKKIVEYAVNFLFGKPVSISKETEDNDEAFALLRDSLDSIYWNDSNRKLSRKLFTQRRAAKLFFIKNPSIPEKRKLAYLLLTAENGSFFPNFADNGDLDAFLRLYIKQDIVNGEVDDVEAFELYTDTFIQSGTLIDGTWVVNQSENPFGKIPVVYYERDFAEWEPAKTLIETQELSISEQVDTNQYNSAPITIIKGQAEALPDKTSQGKSISMTGIEGEDGKPVYGDISYLTWSQMIDAIKLQIDNFEKWIFAMTNTADLSFNSLLNAKPSNMTNSGWKTLLLDSFLEAQSKQELFMPNLHRELNVIMSILGVMETKYSKAFQEMKLNIKFGSVLPTDVNEIITALNTATGGKQIMSQETAVQNNPYVHNPALELERIANDEGLEAGTFNL